MKKIILMAVCLLTLTLTACSSSSSYERDNKPGELKSITIEEMQEKIDKKESFAIMFSQPTCGACIELKALLDKYLPTHNVVMYDVSLNAAEETQAEVDAKLEVIHKTFPGLEHTPSVYYVEDGKMKNEIENGKDGVTEEKFDSWVQSNKLDEKK